MLCGWSTGILLEETVKFVIRKKENADIERGGKNYGLLVASGWKVEIRIVGPLLYPIGAQQENSMDNFTLRPSEETAGCV